MYDTVDLGSMVIHEIRTLRYRGPLVTSRLWAPSLILILKLSPLLTTFRTPLSLMEFWMQVSICAEICAFLLTSSFPFECRASYFAASFFKIFNRWSHLGWGGLCCWCWWFHSNLTLLILSSVSKTSLGFEDLRFEVFGQFIGGVTPMFLSPCGVVVDWVVVCLT